MVEGLVAVGIVPLDDDEDVTWTVAGILQPDADPAPLPHPDNATDAERLRNDLHLIRGQRLPARGLGAQDQQPEKNSDDPFHDLILLFIKRSVRLADAMGMGSIPGPILAMILAVALSAAVAMLFVLAAQVRNATERAALARRVRQLKEDYHARLRALREENDVIVVDPIDEPPDEVAKAA